MELTVLTNVADIHEQGCLHLKEKGKYFGQQAFKVISYIVKKLKLFRGEFFQSNKTIAAECEVSIRTVQIAIKRAQELSIFQVSSRYESTLNSGRMRQTSNCIRLLPFESFTIVKEIVETVRTVTSKVVKTVTETIKKSSKQTKPQQRNTPQKQYSRQEIVPEWIKQPQTSTADVTPEQQQRFDSLQERLKNKYRKRGDSNGSRY